MTPGILRRDVGALELRDGDKNLITRLLRMWLVMLRLMDKPKTTLDKVRHALFGRRSNKRSKSESDMTGHSTCHKVVNFPGNDLELGEVVKVRITAAKQNSLYGEVIAP